MIDNLKWDDSGVSWSFNNNAIKKRLKKVFFVTDDVENEMIYVESGMNFTKECEFLFRYDGDMIMRYNTLNGRIEWNYMGKQQMYLAQNLIQVLYFPQRNLILILQEKENERYIKALNLDGNESFKAKAINGYKLQYLSEMGNKPVAVCDGDDEHADQFGRIRKNFYIDMHTGALEEGDYAY